MIACPSCGKLVSSAHFYPKSGKFRCGPRFWTPDRVRILGDCLAQGFSDDRIADVMGVTSVAVQIARKEHGIPCRTESLLSSAEIARRMGAKCSKTVARWITAGWLNGRPGQYRGANRQWYVRPGALYDFVRDRRHWHRWDPNRIADDELRRYALTVRGGERFLTVGEVAARMSVQIGTVSQWIRRGWLPAARHQNWMVREADLNRFDLPRLGKPKPSWKPCARCGDPDGRIHQKCTTPTRYDGRRYGVAGEICGRCADHLRRAARRAVRKRRERDD